MKKSFNKKILIIGTIIVIMVAIAGVFYMQNKPNKSQAIAPITVTVRKASFASVVNVTLSEEGKKQYKDAVKYQLYYEGKPITQKEQIGKATTAYPARKENDKVAVKLLKIDGKEAFSVDLNLQKEEK
jgi:hypothetical protein